MYSDRRGGGRGGRDGGFGGGRDGGGYGQRRDGGGYGDEYGGRGGGGWGGGSGGGGHSSEIYVDQKHVGRIIGKGGSKIRDLQDRSGANIKVNSREVEDGKVRICLTGGEDSCAHAEDLIMKITEWEDYEDRSGGGGRGGGGGYGGRGGGGGGYDSGRRSCYKCGEEGHIARSCPSQDSYQSDRDRY